MNPEELRKRIQDLSAPASENPPVLPIPSYQNAIPFGENRGERGNVGQSRLQAQQTLESIEGIQRAQGGKGGGDLRDPMTKPATPIMSLRDITSPGHLDSVIDVIVVLKKSHQKKTHQARSVNHVTKKNFAR